jgi:integrase/recombinase XerD
MKHLDPLLKLVESFFREYLARVRGSSRHTILAYRDALRLFFVFLSAATKRPIASLRLEDISAERVLGFLEHLEVNRKSCVATRNARLTAIRSFCRHVLRNEPLLAAQCQRVLSLPSRRAAASIPPYLEPEEARILLAQPNPKVPEGLRDLALLHFLYNTGARVSEVLTVRVHDLQLERPYQVRLHGKGRKERLCPLWPQTAAIIRALVAESNFVGESTVFRNARGQVLSRDGVAYILAKHRDTASRECPALKGKKVTPHVLRRSCAVALLQAGVDINVIRDYLGHESIATTCLYAKVNLHMKRQVLEAFWNRARLSTPARISPWTPKANVLAFLESL